VAARALHHAYSLALHMGRPVASGTKLILDKVQLVANLSTSSTNFCQELKTAVSPEEEAEAAAAGRPVQRRA
jgi:hypothetical protein